MGGKHSARAMQLAGKMYKDAGGAYAGEKTSAQKSMSKWTDEKWGTKSGKPSTQGPKATGERYLPKKAREALSDKEYAATSKAKREGTKAGKQFVKQPKKIAEKTAKYR
jgi:phospholipase/lecithinase/hemolysin